MRAAAGPVPFGPGSGGGRSGPPAASQMSFSERKAAFLPGMLMPPEFIRSKRPSPGELLKDPIKALKQRRNRESVPLSAGGSLLPESFHLSWKKTISMFFLRCPEVGSWHLDLQ